MSNKLDATGLNQVLQSIHQQMAHEAKSVFKTDPDWEASSLAVLQGWVSGNTATDTINNRIVNNYDVYAVKNPKKQYYFDSGDWFLFTPDLTDYFSKGEADALEKMLKEMITEQSCDPLSATEINNVLVAAGFPAIIEDDE